MTKLCDDTVATIYESKDFLKYAYQLRKLDDAQNTFTTILLKDKVQPKILYEIIISNIWNKKQKKIVPN